MCGFGLRVWKGIFLIWQSEQRSGYVLTHSGSAGTFHSADADTFPFFRAENSKQQFGSRNDFFAEPSWRTAPRVGLRSVRVKNDFRPSFIPIVKMFIGVGC